MMSNLFRPIFIFTYWLPACLFAQNDEFVQVSLPDASITATQCLRGDGDTYGLGDWNSTFTVEIDSIYLKIRGEVSFTEKANDFTTIVGQYQSQVVITEMMRCPNCSFSLEKQSGSVSGPNVGARGYQWYNGQGIIRRAKIMTDTFGDDVGKIGGVIQFRTIQIEKHCYFAFAE